MALWWSSDFRRFSSVGLTPSVRRGFPPRTTTPLATQTAYAKYRVASNVCVHAREFQVEPSCHNGCGRPPSFSSPFRWGQADVKPPKQSTESRRATTPRHAASARRPRSAGPSTDRSVAGRSSTATELGGSGRPASRTQTTSIGSNRFGRGGAKGCRYRFCRGVCRSGD